MSGVEAVSGLVTSSEPADHAKVGFHHVHVADPGALPGIAQAFRDAGYILEMITCQDRRADLEKMRLVYTFNQLAAADRHLIHADVAPDEAAPSLVGVYKAADWFEREVWDMYGVRFAGHPDLKRILLPDDADFHALLKDFGQMDAVDDGDGGDDD